MQRKCGKPERCVFIPQPRSMRVESSECRRLCLKQPAYTPCRGKWQRRSEPSLCLTPNRAGKTDQWEAADCAAGSTKHEMCYKICKLALKRHTLRVHSHARTHTRPQRAHWSARSVKVSPHPTVFSGSELLLPNGRLGLRKCDSDPICGRQMIFSCYKSFTTLSCHASPPRCRNAKPQIPTKHRGQMWMFHVKR